MRKSLFALAAVATMFAGAAQAQSANYAIDPTHLRDLEISHFGASVNRARFDKKEGTVQFDRAGKSGKVEISSTPLRSTLARLHSTSTCKAQTCSTQPPTPPSSSFLTSSSSRGDNVSRSHRPADLAGQDSPITLKANQFACYQSPMLKREVCGGDFEATIDRTQWGMEPRRGLGLLQERAPGRASGSCEAVIPARTCKSHRSACHCGGLYAIESTKLFLE